MSSYINVYIHYVFSTKNREPMIIPEIEERLWAYMGGIAKENNMKAIIINGVEDHAHVLLSIPSTISIAKAIQLIKGGSSYWVHRAFHNMDKFEWQKGYGAFSVSQSNLSKTINYIKNQKQHHQKEGFKDEYIEILKRNKVEYDERYIWL